MRFHMAAATYARNQALHLPTTNITRLNRKKATQFRGEGAVAEFDTMVKQMKSMGFGETAEAKAARHEERLAMLRENGKKSGKSRTRAPEVPVDGTAKVEKKETSVLS